jgi:circadian clock protein KaiB
VENELDSTAESGKYKFLLFISGMSVKSGHAIENLRKICDTNLSGNFEIEIIDISLDREQAVNYQIVGIPTLIKTAPHTPRIIMGDLSDTEKVLRILDL